MGNKAREFGTRGEKGCGLLRQGLERLGEFLSPLSLSLSLSLCVRVEEGETQREKKRERLLFFSWVGMGKLTKAGPFYLNFDGNATSVMTKLQVGH